MQTIARSVATAFVAGLAGAVLAIAALPVAGQATGLSSHRGWPTAIRI